MFVEDFKQQLILPVIQYFHQDFTISPDEQMERDTLWHSGFFENVSKPVIKGNDMIMGTTLNNNMNGPFCRTSNQQ